MKAGKCGKLGTDTWNWVLINSEDVGSYFDKAWISIEDAGNAKL
jgi:hypothetical protein